MIGLYLCDDEQAARARLREMLARRILIENYDMTVRCCTGGAEELLAAIDRDESRRGVYFLDVDLKDAVWDGFRLGQEIRRRDPHATLVYITGYGELAGETFRYHLEAFDYIVKDPSRLENSVGQCLKALEARLLAERRDPAELFTLRTGDMVRHIPVDEILFFETAAAPHHVLLHTENSRIDFLGSLNELSGELGERFIRVHRAYLVSAKRIEAIDTKRNRLTVAGRECLLSRTGKAELRKRKKWSL